MKISKTSASYSIEVGDASSGQLKVEINLLNKEFSIEETSGNLKSKGIGLSIGGVKDVDALKSFIVSINKAVELIEEEFEELRLKELESSSSNEEQTEVIN